MDKYYVIPVDHDVINKSTIKPMYISGEDQINMCEPSQLRNMIASGMKWYFEADKKRLFEIINPAKMDEYEGTPVYSIEVGEYRVVDKSSIKAENEAAKAIPFMDNFISKTIQR